MHGKASKACRILSAWVLLCALTTLLVYASGAFRSEPGENSDEASHFITGLMVRDYIAQGFPGSPLRYAENYYLHYPKVALGHWPPLFYVVAGLWLLVFPATVPSVLALMALVSGTLAATVYHVAIREFASRWAGLVAALLVCLPAVQSYTGSPMLDLPVALFSLWATLAWARYSASSRLRHALEFGLWSSCAILTKGSGVALVFMPPLAMLLSRNFQPLRWRATWISVGVIGLLCGPWTLLTAHLVTPTWQGGRWWDFVGQSAVFYTRTLVGIVGTAIFACAALGVWDKVVRPWRTSATSPLWASLTGLALGSWLFQLLIPVGFDWRFLLSTAPPLLLLMAAGVAWAARRASWIPLATPRRVQALALLIGLLFLLGMFRIPPKHSYGFGEAAEAVLRGTGQSNAVVLCSSEANGEGMLVAAIAQRERRPGHIVLRATKILAQSDWNGGDYRLLYQTPEEMLQYLASIRVKYLVLDLYPGPFHFRHHGLLRRMLEECPGHWRRVGAYPQEEAGAAPGSKVEVYKAVNLESGEPREIRLDMTRTLKKVLAIQPPS